MTPAPLASGWLIAALISSLIALCQFFGIAEHWEPWVSASQGVAYANLRQRNHFASLTVIGFAALLYGAAQWRGLVGQWGRWAGLLAMGLLVTANAASASRTGLLALVLVCGLVVGWRKSVVARAQHLAWLALPVYGVAAWVLPHLVGRVGAGSNAFSRLAEGDELCASRLTLWSNVLHLIAQKPWWGWGWAELDYAHFITLFPGPRFCALLDNAHNLPLHLAVELGLPFALVAGALVVRWVWRRQPWSEAVPGRQMAWSVLAVIALHSMLEFPLWYGPFQMTLVMCLMILWQRKPPAKGSDVSVKNHAYAHHAYALFASLLIAVVVYVGWDYYRISQIFLPPERRAATYRDDTLNKIKDSWLFKGHVQFAALSTTPLTTANAAAQHALALQVLHFSPEPLVVQRLMDSAVILGLADEVSYYGRRFEAAYPADYRRWAAHVGAMP